MKRLVFVSVLILSATLVFGSAEKEGQEEVSVSVTVQNAFLGNEMPILLEEFHAQNPNITGKMVPIAMDGWVDYFTKIRTLIAGGEAPDLMYVAIEGAKYVAETGLAIPLDDYMAKNPAAQEIVDDLHPKLQSAFEFDGKTWGTVFGWNNVVTHINTDMLEDVGLDFPSEDWDYAEFLDYAKALTREVDGEQVFGVSIPGGFFMINAWLYSFGASLLNDDWTESTFDTPEALAAFQAMYDLVYLHKVAPAYAGNDQSINLFTNEQVGMCFLGRWPLPSWIENGINFDIQYMPNAGARQVIFGSGAFMVGSASPHPAEAYTLGSFLSSAWSQRTAIGVNTIPTSISVMDEILPKSVPANSMIFRKSADVAKPVPSPPEFPEIAQVFMRYYGLMMADEMPVKDVVNAIHVEVNEILGN